MRPKVTAWAMADGPNYLDGFLYLGAVALGRKWLGVINHSDEPVSVVSVCRSDLGRDFRNLPEPLAVSPGRTVWLDMEALPARSWTDNPDPNLDYQLVSSFSMFSQDGIHWFFGTEDEPMGPVLPRPALGDL